MKKYKNERHNENPDNLTNIFLIIIIFLSICLTLVHTVLLQCFTRLCLTQIVYFGTILFKYFKQQFSQPLFTY